MAILLRMCFKLATGSDSVRAAGASAPTNEKRGFLRMKTNCRATLALLDASDRGPSLPVRCANVSEYGALILSGRPLDSGATVVLTIPSLRLTGIGRVRRCARRRFRFLVGIEFASALRRTELGEWTIRKSA